MRNVIRKEAPTIEAMKSFDVSLEFTKGLTEDGTFEGYASLYDKLDRDGDVMAPGCFDKFLGKLKKPSIVKMFRDHDRRQVIGAWSEIKPDRKGLFVRGQLALKVAAGLETYELMKIDALEALSIGFMSVKAEPIAPNSFGRKFLEVELLEISVVSIPALPQARVTGVKSFEAAEVEVKQIADLIQKAADKVAIDNLVAAINRARAALIQ